MIQKEAEIFAEAAHESIDQKRKYTNEPYIIHPRNVAYLVKCIGGTDEMVSAAFLHDVIEDVMPLNQNFSDEIILNRFGKNILNMVQWLSDIYLPKVYGGNREKRKSLERERYKDAPNEVKTIKLADLIDNTLTICEHDKGFAKVYLKEKELLMPYLIGGDRFLWIMAKEILLRSQKDLKS